MKSIIHKIIHEANFLSLAGNLIIAIFGFAGFALLARTYDMNQFGEWILLVAGGSFVEMFRFGITNTALIRYLSGATAQARNQYLGANYIIGIAATLFIVLLIYVAYIAFPQPIEKSGYSLFFLWYPLLAIANLPYNTALVILQADMKFDKILLIKTIYSGLFFLVVLVNFIIPVLSTHNLAIAQIAIATIVSILCVIKGWDGIRDIHKSSKAAARDILNFGKYTTFTLIGTNLLRSADTLIISFSPMGTAAVALYSIPLKLTEIQQIPLRSFVATAFPKMSKYSMQSKIAELKSEFYTYSGAITYLFIGICLFTFVFADFFVLVLGGQQYLGTDPLTGASASNIVRVFSLYGLLLPIDRMTGIGLDSINKPDKNFVKVLIMVAANIIGDILAVFVFKSLMLVAIVSILFTAIGVFIGYYYLNKELNLEWKQIFIEGFAFYKKMRAKFAPLAR